jgi:soluble cytochrome b562
VTTIGIDSDDQAKINQTLSAMKRLIIDLMKEAYFKIYGEDHMEFAFPQYPIATVSQILMLEEQDIISTKSCKGLLLQHMGLSSDLIFNGENEHKRPRLSGNKESVKPYMDLLLETMKAEVKQVKSEVKQGEAKTTAEVTKMEAEAVAIESGDVGGPASEGK